MDKDFIFTDEKDKKYLVINNGTEQFNKFFDRLLEVSNFEYVKFFNDHKKDIISFQFSKNDNPDFCYWCTCEINAVNDNKENYLLTTIQTHLPDLVEIFEDKLDLSFLTTPEIYKELLEQYLDVKNSTDEDIEISKEQEQAIENVQAFTPSKEELLEILEEPEERVQDTTDEVVFTEPEKKKRGRPSIKGVAAAIKVILDFTKQKPRITEKTVNNVRTILSYDRHKEKYEVIEDTYEPIGYVEPFKEVIKRGLVPEMKSSNLVYGVSYKMETPVARCLRVKKQLAETEKLVNDATLQAGKIKEYRETLENVAKVPATNKENIENKGDK